MVDFPLDRGCRHEVLHTCVKRRCYARQCPISLALRARFSTLENVPLLHLACPCLLGSVPAFLASGWRAPVQVARPCLLGSFWALLVSRYFPAPNFTSESSSRTPWAMLWFYQQSVHGVLNITCPSLRQVSHPASALRDSLPNQWYIFRHHNFPKVAKVLGWNVDTGVLTKWLSRYYLPLQDYTFVIVWLHALLMPWSIGLCLSSTHNTSCQKE